MNKKTIITILVSFALWSCNPVKQGNMKWIAKYDFNQLYQLTDQATVLDPMSAFRFESFKAPNENTIILIGNKRLRAFDSIQNGYQAVLHISKDRGKSYQELLLPEQEMKWIDTSQYYSLVEAQSRLPDNSKKISQYLLDHKSLKLVKIDEYDSEADISYYNFNGKYAVYSHNKALKLINLLNREEEYPLPDHLNNQPFYLTAQGNILTLQKNQIISYDPKTQNQQIIKSFKNNYDILLYQDDTFVLGKPNLLKTSATFYNEEEKELYTIDSKNANFYRYKNFVCDYKSLSSIYPSIRYSYDYGQTWFEQKFTGFFSASRPIGFYKDK
ncbi:hypothetical protein GQ591_12000, partial [Gilliamella sp. Lep-s5]